MTLEEDVTHSILIIEDEPEMAQLLEAILSEVGYDVEIAYDGMTGLQLTKSFRPDLVLLDIMMPGLDGWDVLRHLREFSDIPVIMLTAQDGPDNVVHGLDLGADDYLSKPCTRRELKARIRAALRRAKLKKHNLECVSPDQFDIRAIRELIRDAFMAQELYRFCRDRPVFRPILSYIGPNACLETTIDAMIDYCQTRVLIPDLIEEIREFNPRQYAQHAEKLFNRSQM